MLCHLIQHTLLDLSIPPMYVGCFRVWALGEVLRPSCGVLGCPVGRGPAAGRRGDLAGRPGTVLGRHRAVLEPSWVIEVILAVLVGNGAIFGASWGRALELPWARLGSYLTTGLRDQ